MEFKIGHNYRISKKIGKGAFGDIYLGFDEKRERNVAIKIEPITNKNLQLAYEMKMIKKLEDGIGIPRVYYFGPEDIYNVMVMDLLGPSLEDLLLFCNGTFSLKTVCMLAQEMLLRIQFIHERHIVHRDIKPSNFVLGVDEMANVIYLIDYGLSKQFYNPDTDSFVPYREGKNMVGTARYSSIANHLGIEQSRRDDLESLGYVLIYFLKGKLPWQGLSKHIGAKDKGKNYRILEKKVSIPLSELCKDLPEEFEEYLNYTRNLYFDEKPDYAYLRSLFRDVMENRDMVNDGVYDWVTLSPNSHTTDFSLLPSFCVNECGQLLFGLDKPATCSVTQHMICDENSNSDISAGNYPTLRPEEKYM